MSVVRGIRDMLVRKLAWGQDFLKPMVSIQEFKNKNKKTAAKTSPAMAKPNPTKNLAAVNMRTDCDAVCSAVPAIMITAPTNTVFRRPKPSERYGATGQPAKSPML